MQNLCCVLPPGGATNGGASEHPGPTVGRLCAATTNNALLVTRTGFGGYPVGQLPNLMPKG